MREWLQLAARRDVVTRARRVALPARRILTVINQGDMILSGMLTPAVIARIALTFCVPYCVSTYAAVEAIRQQPG